MSRMIMETSFNIEHYICDVVLYKSEKIISVRVQGDKIVVSYISNMNDGDCVESEECISYTFRVGGEGEYMGKMFYVDTLEYNGDLLYVLCDKEI